MVFFSVNMFKAVGKIILKEWDDNLSVGPSKGENWIDWHL